MPGRRDGVREEMNRETETFLSSVLFRKRILFLTLTLLVMGTIFWFSAQPATESQAISDGFLAWILEGGVPLLSALAKAGVFQWLSIRKCAHAGIYLVLGFCAAMTAGTWEEQGNRKFLAAWLFCVLYAGSDEWHQFFVPGRSCEWRDVGIDACGALAGVLLATGLCAFRNKKQERGGQRV